MKVRRMDILFVITNILAAFVVCLCASVSKILPFFVVVALAAALAVIPVIRLGAAFAAIKQYTQKRE